MTTEGSGLSLEIVEGPGAGRLVPVHGALEIGRGTAAGLRLEDEEVSELHVRVSPAHGVLLVQDLGDPGGTFVNDAEVRATTRMRPGDELQVGVTVFELRSAADLAERPSAVRPVPPGLA